MIAANYYRFPESLAYQRELFSIGHHPSVRLMRCIQVIFDWSAWVPDWCRQKIAAAKRLAKAVRASIVEMFDGCL